MIEINNLTDDFSLINLLELAYDTMEYLNLSFINSENLNQKTMKMVSNLTKLEYFSLMGCKKLSSIDILAIAQIDKNP